MSMQSVMYFSVQILLMEQIPASNRQLVMLCISTSWQRTTKLQCGSDLWNSFKSAPHPMVMAGFQRRAPWKLIGWSSPLPPKTFYKQLAASANQDMHDQIAVAAVAVACNAPTFVFANHVKIVKKACTAAMSITCTRKRSLTKQKWWRGNLINRLIEL